MKDLVARNFSIPELDGFRGIAILIVCIYHLDVDWNFLPLEIIHESGWIAVPLFFILSGFLLSLDFIRAGIENSVLPDTLEFYKKRAFRIFPLYYFSLILVIVHKFLDQELPPLSEVISHFFFLHNFENFNSHLYSPYWSLAVEIQIYLIFPLFGYILYNTIRLKAMRLLTGFLGLLILAPLCYRIFLSVFWEGYRPDSHYIQWIYSFTFSNLDSFGFGIVAAVIYMFYVRTKQNRFGWTISIASLLLIGFLMYFSYQQDGWKLQAGIFAPALFYTLLNASWSAMILGLLMTRNSWLNSVFSGPVLRFFSIISFSLYVWHGHMYNVARIIVARTGVDEGPIFDSLLGVFGITLAIALSWCAWKYLEVPFMKMRTGGMRVLRRAQ